MRCERCRAEPQLRVEWGCNEDAPIPLATLEYRGRQERIMRCPIKLIATTPRVPLVLEAYRWLNAHHLLPNPGGWLEQPAGLLEAFRIVEDELGSLRKDKG